MPKNEFSATERFVDVLETACGAKFNDELRVRLEDAFNDAVDARVEKALAEANQNRGVLSHDD